MITMRAWFIVKQSGNYELYRLIVEQSGDFQATVFTKVQSA